MDSGTEIVQIGTKLKTTRPKTKRSRISVTYWHFIMADL